MCVVTEVVLKSSQSRFVNSEDVLIETRDDGAI
jgi:hypothetical protein